MIRTTFDSAPAGIFTRWPTRKGPIYYKSELDVTGMKGEYGLGRVGGGRDLGGRGSRGVGRDTGGGTRRGARTITASKRVCCVLLRLKIATPLVLRRSPGGEFNAPGATFVCFGLTTLLGCAGLVVR